MRPTPVASSLNSFRIGVSRKPSMSTSIASNIHPIPARTSSRQWNRFSGTRSSRATNVSALAVTATVSAPPAAFAEEELGAEHRGAGRATNGVVREDNVADTEGLVRANATDDRGHTAFRVAVQDGLRSIAIFSQHDGTGRRRGQIELLRPAAELAHRSGDVGD